MSARLQHKENLFVIKLIKRLRTGLNLEFSVNITDMGTYGFSTDIKLFANFFVSVSFRKPVEYFRLPFAQIVLQFFKAI